MSDILRISPQPNYPHEDISETNSETVKQLILDPDYMEKATRLAQRNVITCKLGYVAINQLLAGLQVDRDQFSAFNTGVEAYQALVATVRPGLPAVQMDSLHSKCIDVAARQYDGFKAALSLRDIEEEIRDSAPVTTDMIDRVSQLHPALDPRLVLQGAGLEREIERSSIVDIHDLEML